jgi:hypothetical protein
MRMRRSVRVALCVSALAAASSVTCWWRASTLRTEAEWLMARGNAQAEEFANTLDGAVADQQMGTFEARRSVLERAHLWQRLQLLSVMLTVVAAFSTYVLHLLAKIRSELQEVTDETQPPLPSRSGA